MSADTPTQTPEATKVRAAALLEAADEIHAETRWQEEQRRRCHARADAHGVAAHAHAVERLLLIEDVLGRRAHRLLADSGEAS